MKNYIQEHFGERLGYPALRIAVNEAWEAVSEDYLRQLSQEIRKRCQTVIDVNDMYTRY